jgi:predicted RNA binding protein YcfA (HicA-like mRNA interferase family)
MADLPGHGYSGDLCAAAKYGTGQDDDEGGALKVRARLKLLKKDGWEVDRMRGDHRQLVHPAKRGTVTVSVHPNDDVHPKTLKSILRQAGLEADP